MSQFAKLKAHQAVDIGAVFRKLASIGQDENR
jgi:hypothetical protein